MVLFRCERPAENPAFLGQRVCFVRNLDQCKQIAILCPVIVPVTTLPNDLIIAYLSYILVFSPTFDLRT